MILSLLTPRQLEFEARATHFPKWNTMCLLKLLGLPTLDAAFIPPGTERQIARSLVSYFASYIGKNTLLVRSDGGREAKAYPVGGNSLAVPDVVRLVLAQLADHRAALLLEPTNRFNNRRTVQTLIDPEQNMSIEILGPGFDVSDLTRGGVSPHFVAELEVSVRRHETLWAGDIYLAEDKTGDAVRRQRRLNNIGSKILPGMGLVVEGNPATFAEFWLKQRGLVDIWRTWTPEWDVVDFQGWYDNAFTVACELSRFRSWKTFVLSGSALDDCRWIYWDVVEGERKWGPARGATVKGRGLAS